VNVPDGCSLFNMLFYKASDKSFNDVFFRTQESIAFSSQLHNNYTFGNMTQPNGSPVDLVQPYYSCVYDGLTAGTLPITSYVYP
jgi:hypothetical protein